MANYIKIYMLASCRYTDHINHRHLYWFLLLSILSIPILNAQTDIILQDVILGKADVSAPGSVTLRPGFRAAEGSNFHAFIGPLQGQNSSTIINPPSGSSTPAAGTAGMNYVKTISYREAQSSVPGGSFKHIEEIQYIDGLGRATQTIQVGASPGGNDIIQPVLYDLFGREAITTLPYTGTKTGEFRTGVTESTVNTYYSSSTPTGIIADNRAYSQTTYDNSPLNRILSQTGPGADWETNSKRVYVSYFPNTTSIASFKATGINLYTSISYPAYSLYITESIDEQGNYTREYKDKLGQVVIKESKLGSLWLQTQYIYDDFGLLRCVMPPEATSPADLQLCYYYFYDSRRRLKEKRIPGGGSVIMVYDKGDRLRYTQGSTQAIINEWTFTKYDELNRPVITGKLNNYSAGAAALELATNAISLTETRNNSLTNGYTNVSYPTSNTDVLTVAYYDDYTFFNITGIPIGDSLRSTTYDIGSYNIQSKLAAANKERVTGSMTMVLSDAADAGAITKNKLYNTLYYDKYGHLLRSISDNHLGGKDVATSLYEDITYQITQNKQEHHKGNEHITIEKWFEYDHTGRLLATREKVNSQPEFTVNAMKYNEVGELITKYYHSNQTSGTRSFIQKTDYQYNIRGWLAMINDPALGGDNDMFGMQLFYNSISGMGSLAPLQGLYNGNIVGIKWGTKNEVIRGYQFSYDNLNRMLQGNYAEGASLNTNAGYYSETISLYDKNGNIKGLQRKYNNSVVDNLTYTYFSDNKNRLQRVMDSGTASSLVDDYPGNSQDYIYDTNGNMTKDGAKNFFVYYNSTLNLPKQLDFQNNNRIFYHYTADGAKLLKHTVPATGTGTLTHYIGNIVYEGGTLIYILTDEGRLVANGTGTDRKFLYEYNLKDHLGDSRVTFMGTDLGGAVDIVQTTSYYPFGLVMNQMNGNSAPGYKKNKYLYNGKELQDDKMTSEALNWFDYGARFYDPQIGRFHTIDPLTEKNHSQSGFVYAANNPIKYIDFMGLDSAQRATAVALAEEYVNKNTGNTYPTQTDIDNGDFKGKPGEKVDCSGMVSNCIVKAEEPDPNTGTGKTGNGVNRIAQSSELVTDKNDVQVGNAITLDNSTSGTDKPMGHAGIIVEVKRNDQGEVTGYKIIDSGGRPSTGKSGPRYTNITLGGKGYWDSRVTGIYKWDKKPD